MAQELDEWAPPTLILQAARHVARPRPMHANPLTALARLALVTLLGSHRRH